MRRFGFLLLPLACAGGFAACGGSNSGDDDSSAATDGGGTDGTVNGDAQGSGDGSTDSAIPPFSPTDFGARLVLWLDASQLVSTRDGGLDASPIVTVWGDRSPSHNDSKPFSGNVFDVAGTSDAGANGLPILRFDGAAVLVSPETPSLVWGTGDFSLFVVYRSHNTNVQPALVVGKYDTVGPFPGPNLYASYFVPPSTNIAARVDSLHYVETIDGGYSDDKLRVVGMRRSGVTLELRVDGVSFVNDDAGAPDGAPIDVSAPDAGFFVGGRPTLLDFLEGDVAEVVGIKGTLNDAELTELEAYLKSKYGL